MGPRNTPLEEGFVLDEMGRVLSYKGTTVKDVEEMRRLQGLEDVRGERKKNFQELRKKIDDMEQKSQAALREERRLIEAGRSAKKATREVEKGAH